MSNSKELTTEQKIIEDFALKARKGIMKKIMIYLFIFSGVLCVVLSLFLNLHPVFGGIPSKEQKEVYKKFDNYVNGKFVNQVPTNLDMSLSDHFSVMKDSISGGVDRTPAGQIPVSEINWNKINSEENSLTWFGHSAFLLSIDNKKILVDPMLVQLLHPFHLQEATATREIYCILLDNFLLLMLSLLPMIITIT